MVKRAGPRTKLQLKDVDIIDEPRAANIDPMWLQWMSLTQDALPGDAHPGTGFLSYSMLRAMARVPPVAAIIKTRQNQAADFARQQPRPGAIGWRVVQKDKNKKPSRASEKNVRQICEVIQRAGGQYYLGGFEAFIRTAVADSLTLDQCHPAGTYVETPQGASKIEQVRVGDMVRSHTGVWREVLRTMTREFTGDIYTIKARGQELRATPEHPLLVATNRWLHLAGQRDPKLAWLQARDIQPGMRLAYPKPAPVKGEVPELPWGNKLCAKWAWALGYYVANGNAYPTCANFTLHSGRPDLEEKLQAAALTAGFRFATTPYKNRKAVNARINMGEDTTRKGGGVQYGHWLEEVCGKGAGQKRVPAFILEAPSELRCAFICGYLQGDGMVNVARGRASFNTTSVELFHGMRLLLALEGVYAAATETAEGGVPGSGWADQKRASLSGAAFRALAAKGGLHLLEPENTTEPYCQDDSFFYLKVNKVSREPVEGLDVFNVEVAVDNSYVANGYVSHNCNAELIFTKGGLPWGFIPVDPATIRRKAPTHAALSDNRWDYQEQSYIQVIQNEIVNEFSHDELMWGIRNPRSLVYAAGYGHPELENLTGILTAYINTMTYNVTRYTVGTHADYLLALYSKDSREKADGLRRLMESGQSGVRGSRRNLVLQLNKSLDEEVKAVELPRSQMTAQDAMWLDGLVEDICAHYAIDPSEINHVRKSNQGAPPDLSKASPSDRVFMSKERGLRPLLRSIAQWINYWVVEPYWPDYEFDFVGFDAQSERDRLDHMAKSVSLWMTPNEIRAEVGLPLLDDPVSNLPLHGSYAAWLQRQAQDGLDETDPGPTESFDSASAFLDGVRMPVADEPA